MKESRTGEGKSNESKKSRDSKGVCIEVYLDRDLTELELKKIHELYFLLKTGHSGKHSLKVERHDKG